MQDPLYDHDLDANLMLHGVAAQPGLVSRKMAGATPVGNLAARRVAWSPPRRPPANPARAPGPRRSKSGPVPGRAFWANWRAELRLRVLVCASFGAGVLVAIPLVLAVRSHSHSVAVRPAPFPVATTRRPVAPGLSAFMNRRPGHQGAGRMATIVPPSAATAGVAPLAESIVVPPLDEDAPEPEPVASAEDLKRLRNEYRRVPVLRLETIMEGVRRACGSDAWQRNGWRDYRLEFALDELIYRVKRATERPELNLPVRFGELPSGVAENASGVLTACRSIKMRSANRCIFLVDGDVDLVEARECLILTTGKVNVPYGRGNIILAGGNIEGAENMGQRGNQPRLSLRISGKAVSLRSCCNLIFSAPLGVEASAVQDSVLLNSPIRTLSYLSGCSEYTTNRVDFRLEVPREPGGRSWRPDDGNREDSAVPRRAVSRSRSTRR